MFLLLCYYIAVNFQIERDIDQYNKVDHCTYILYFTSYTLNGTWQPRIFKFRALENDHLNRSWQNDTCCFCAPPIVILKILRKRISFKHIMRLNNTYYWFNWPLEQIYRSLAYTVWIFWWTKKNMNGCSFSCANEQYIKDICMYPR